MERGKGTIDLRKTPSGVAPKSQSHIEQAPVGRETVPTHVGTLAPALPASLEWTAFEHEQVDFGPSWYVVPGGIMAILFALALFVQNYFFALFVLIAFAAFMLFRNQPPKKISFSIGKEGVHAGNTLYRISNIKSFWIFNRPEHLELSLETSQTFSPYVRLPLGDTDQQRIREFLLTILPEQQHQQFLLDEIMRIIGF
ncbi:MAG: hypothetical protein HY007_00995 [Candidatus Sungbacteria bacterium]|nr:hypothetical protein [Candidatus Sungbacteria bacterium]